MSDSRSDGVTNRYYRFFHLRTGYIQMGAGAHAVFAGERERDAVRTCTGSNVQCGHARARGVEENQIGFRLLDRDALDLSEAARQHACVLVIFGKAVDMMVQRVDAGRGTDPALAHGATEPLLPAPGLADKRLRA